jgi:glycerol-3-phosphate dehydrogenase (NAD(P)+)
VAAALADADVVIVAVPSEFFAAALARLAPSPRVAIVSATKGFDPVRHLRMSELVRERFPAAPVAALSGPTFAREVALGRPTAAVVASADEALATELQARLGSRELRLYTNRDLVGVEAGGALKNVVAIATGIADGLGLGENARAALVTRGLAEMTRLAVALGGEPATLAGLAGVGDLVLTATGTLSRNRALGMALARGDSLARAAGSTRMVAEGVPTVRTALTLAREHGVTMPICAEVAAVLFAAKPPAEGLASLLGRVATREDAAAGARRA